MGHIHDVFDTDRRFSINPATRELTNMGDEYCNHLPCRVRSFYKDENNNDVEVSYEEFDYNGSIAKLRSSLQK